jgi:P-type conjugative transfer protein TrbJ
MKPFACALLAAATAVTIGSAAVSTPATAMPVFDAGNYTQNVLSAARALEQITHQIESLQNEATMIRQQARQLQKLDFSGIAKLDANFRKIEELIEQARGIGFNADRLEQQVGRLFPGSATPGARGDRLAAARARLHSALGALRGAIALQAQVVENVQADRQLLAGLVDKSDNAVGSLQAQQATNQLLALAAHQQFQLQAMLASQQRAESITAARAAQAEIDGQAATRRFIGDGGSYTPR